VPRNNYYYKLSNGFGPGVQPIVNSGGLIYSGNPYGY